MAEAALPAVGVLGCGNMGGALARGLVASGACPAARLSLCDTDTALLARLAGELGAGKAADAADLARRAEVLILAVKPQAFQAGPDAFRALPAEPARTVISIMAGVSSARLRAVFPAGWTVVRAMPNLPLSLGQGATAIEADGHGPETLALAERVFAAVGIAARVPASHMDAVTGLSGSGPMYLFEFAEGLIQAGVKAGLARATARELALQTLKGSLALLEADPVHPSEWSARVCSPGGTTIHALQVLESAGFKGVVMRAVEAAVARSRELGG